jgi:hypothetical protein
MARKKTVKRMSEKDKEAWDTLYEYVRTNLLGYDKNQSLSSSMVLRLKGLLVNKFMENCNIKDTAHYSYEVVLNTFKFCAPEILKAFNNNYFKDEMYRFNYMLKIVESHLNTVYMRMRDAEKTKESINNHNASDEHTYVNTFKASEDNHNRKNKYDNLW